MERRPAPSSRVLITGLATHWGGRLAQALEHEDGIEAIIGVDSRDPTLELERTEFVRVSTQHALLRRLVDAAEIDTVIDTRLVSDSTTTSPRNAHENNVIGTMNILAACSGPGSSVRKLVFKSSAHYYGTAQDDPGFFTEAMARPHPPSTPIERDIVEAEGAVAEFAERSGAAVSLLRCANVIGPDLRTAHSRLFDLPVLPTIFGFDPRYQFVHEDDVVGALRHATTRDMPGIYNVAADGVLALTEVAGLLGKTYVPLLPPVGTGLAALGLRRLGVRIPPEMLGQMRFGRGLDNRKLKAAGYEYRYTTREAVQKLAEYQRLHPILRNVQEPYRYERDVEEFLRWSPNVVDASIRGEGRLSPRQIVELRRLLEPYEEMAAFAREEENGAAPAAPAASRGGSEKAPVERYDDLRADEIVSLVGSLDRPALEALRAHEQGARARRTVLSAIDRALKRADASEAGR